MVRPVSRCIVESELNYVFYAFADPSGNRWIVHRIKVYALYVAHQKIDYLA